MAQTRQEQHLVTQELATLAIGPAEVTVHLLGGQIIEGYSQTVSITRRGFPIRTGAPNGEETWVPVANLKYIVLGTQLALLAALTARLVFLLPRLGPVTPL